MRGYLQVFGFCLWESYHSKQEYILFLPNSAAMSSIFTELELYMNYRGYATFFSLLVG